MTTNKLQHIELTESFILGWKKAEHTLTMYFEFLLGDRHPDFEPFDRETTFGCYRPGCITFHEVREVTGLQPETLLPKWNEALSEYYDIYEMDAFNFEGAGITIASDQHLIRFGCEAFDVEIVSSDEFPDSAFGTL